MKWAITEQFQEYLQWKLFVVKTDNNPLTYILTTPNLDVTQHHWVESLAGLTFSIKYQKGRDNAVADSLSHVMSKLDAEVVKSILDGVTVGTIGRLTLMTQQWQRLMKGYRSRLRKLQSR